ncbi:HAMP domain-containing histidine kinase [Bacteroidales bacterium OttesenSCG-928-B11]|nr:HAMP domain-containing histidine kinase [Bacteroidales bacterium OttesenSCG-928-E04]MDL2308231.1 HAMP domain-containing histidine kinase [Bacteroidales bacterium OttesenSCG-928-C03]MDL2311531.1 HAMP domain-containing histidine kinase [Bacteroidales bacterium OttesenSCG-928-B11]
MSSLIAQENAQLSEAKKILLLNSYHHTLPWNLDFEEGVKRYLFNNKYDVYLEYLDTKRRIFDSAEEKKVADLLTFLYGEKTYDLVFVVGNPALNFMIRMQDSLPFIAHTPIIAANITTTQELSVAMKSKDIFIFREIFDHGEMIDEMLQLFPETEQFFIVIRHDVAGEAFKQDFLRQIADNNEIPPHVDFQFNTSNDIEQLVKQVEALPENALILTCDFSCDANNQYYPMGEVITTIRKHSELPLFSVGDISEIGNTTGAYAADPKKQGFLLGEKVAAYLEEEQPFANGVDSTSIKQEWFFNKQNLEQYDIAKRMLPAGATIINDNQKTNKILGFIIIALLLLLMVIYLFNRVLKNRIKINTQYLSDEVDKNVKLRENLEMMLEKAQEMMVQNDRYMASNLHDIKNLVLPIVAYSELMQAEDLPIEKMKKMAGQLNESAQSLVDMSANLFEVNKVRGNLMRIEPGNFNLYLKIQDLVVALDVSLANKKIRLKNQVEPQLHVFADSETINSILINLINNAIKFTPENGEIIVNSQYITDGYVQINVIDSGVGIDEKKVAEIFSQQRYFTQKGTAGEKGTGVGLVLANDLIEKNGGKLFFKNNEEGVGATFSFTLPILTP